MNRDIMKLIIAFLITVNLFAEPTSYTWFDENNEPHDVVIDEENYVNDEPQESLNMALSDYQPPEYDQKCPPKKEAIEIYANPYEYKQRQPLYKDDKVTVYYEVYDKKPIIPSEKEKSSVSVGIKFQWGEDNKKKEKE